MNFQSFHQCLYLNKSVQHGHIKKIMHLVCEQAPWGTNRSGLSQPLYTLSIHATRYIFMLLNRLEQFSLSWSIVISKQWQDTRLMAAMSSNLFGVFLGCISMLLMVHIVIWQIRPELGSNVRHVVMYQYWSHSSEFHDLTWSNWNTWFWVHGLA